MARAKTKGAWVFIQARPAPMALPSQTPIGPIRKAVSGIMMARQKKGTKTICRFGGKTFCRNL